MALSPGGRVADFLPRDHGFHQLRVGRVVRETPDASSFVLEIPPELGPAYAYEPGQFLTFRCWIDGEPHLRCYSMSSAPEIDEALQVTVKRVNGGVVSNWMVDLLAPGDPVETTLPSGVFGRRSGDGDVLAFAGGSGITPILSVLKAVLGNGRHRARLFYANRDRDSVIFDSALARLADESNGRLGIEHHLDTERGLVDLDELRRAVPNARGADCYVCGPGPFMEIVESALVGAGADPDAIHVERFTPLEDAPFPEPPRGDDGPVRVTIELDGKTDTAEHRPGTTVLQTARQLGLAPPFSCEAGNCATCMARLVEGEVTMYTNNALTDDEVTEGWILTCQAVPNESVRVVYGWED